MTTIKFQGKPLNLSGDFPVVGETTPDFLLVSEKLQEMSLGNYQGKRKILCIVPSIDTPVCAASTRMFNQKADKYENTVVLVVSADLPFAQNRFCEGEGLKNVVALSSFRSTFAEDYGVNIVDTVLAGLTARAIIVLDEENQVVYTELVEELSDEPDYEQVLEAFKNL